MKRKTVIVKHYANIGDLISTLAGLKSYAESKNRTLVYCQQLNVVGDYLGQPHPTKDKDDKMVMCNQQMFNMIKPLLLAQNYISDFQVFNGQKIEIDLDVIRSKVFINVPHQAIQQWPIMAYPKLATDLSKTWITVPKKYDDLFEDSFKDKIIVNFTERWRNPTINYYFLKTYQDKLVFAGTPKERELFCENWELDIPYLEVKDFLHLATALKKCKFLLSNQSFIWNLSFAMHTPHILELFQNADNCQTFIGKHSYGYLHQEALDYYFALLMYKI